MHFDDRPHGVGVGKADVVEEAAARERVGGVARTFKRTAPLHLGASLGGIKLRHWFGMRTNFHSPRKKSGIEDHNSGIHGPRLVAEPPPTIA
jgi:hypothetical protein